MLWQQDAIIRVDNRFSDRERNMMEQRHLCQINRHAHILTQTSIQEKKWS